MNILHFISSSGLFGAERVILNLAGQKLQGITQKICALENTHNPHLEILSEAKASGIETHSILSNGSFDLRAILKLRAFIKSQRIDIVHSHNYKSDIIACLASRGLKTKWVATNHNWLTDNRTVAFYEILDAFCLKFADCVIAVNDLIAKNLQETGIHPQKISVIYNGVPMPDQSGNDPESVKVEFGIKEGEHVIATIGRLSKEKGHSVFLNAAHKILQHMPNVKFLIVGDGPLKDDLQAESAALNISEHVIFTGFRPDINRILAITDVLINSSHIEGVPMCILEAMAASIPVVATSVGAVPQIIDNQQNGILVDPDNPFQIAHEVCRLLENTRLRATIGQNAKTTIAARFSSRAMAEAYQRIYKIGSLKF